MISAVGRILNSVESHIEFLNQRFKKHTDQVDIFSIAMEVDKATFGLSTSWGGNLEIGNGLVVLSLKSSTASKVRYTRLT